METVKNTITKIRLFFGDAVYAQKAFHTVFNPLLKRCEATKVIGGPERMGSTKEGYIFDEFTCGINNLRLFKLETKVMALFPLGQYYENTLNSLNSASHSEAASLAGRLILFSSSVEMLLVKVFSLKNVKNLVTFHDMASELLKESQTFYTRSEIN